MANADAPFIAIEGMMFDLIASAEKMLMDAMLPICCVVSCECDSSARIMCGN